MHNQRVRYVLHRALVLYILLTACVDNFNEVYHFDFATFCACSVVQALASLLPFSTCYFPKSNDGLASKRLQGLSITLTYALLIRNVLYTSLCYQKNSFCQCFILFALA